MIGPPLHPYFRKIRLFRGVRVSLPSFSTLTSPLMAFGDLRFHRPRSPPLRVPPHCGSPRVHTHSVPVTYLGTRFPTVRPTGHSDSGPLLSPGPLPRLTPQALQESDFPILVTGVTDESNILSPSFLVLPQTPLWVLRSNLLTRLLYVLLFGQPPSPLKVLEF